MAKSKTLKNAAADLRRHALIYPETVEDFPWEHSAFKVKGKTFLFTYLDDESGSLSLSIKLPTSGKMALTLPFATSTGYGLGKSGWVTCQFSGNEAVPIEMLLEWIDESFRAVAPKRVLAVLEANAPTPTKPGRTRKKS